MYYAYIWNRPLKLSIEPPSPFTWTLELFIITYNVLLKKSIKVTQSPKVPRVRGGDPSGVAPGKVEDNISGSGHPGKLISWKLGRCIHPLCNGWSFIFLRCPEGAKNDQFSWWSLEIFLWIFILFLCTFILYHWDIFYQYLTNKI